MNDTQGQPWYVRVSKDVRAHRTVGGRCRGLNDMFSLCNKNRVTKQLRGVRASELRFTAARLSPEEKTQRRRHQANLLSCCCPVAKT